MLWKKRRNNTARRAYSRESKTLLEYRKRLGELDLRNDGAADNKNFSIKYSLQADKTYYLGVKLYSWNTNTNVTVSVTRS